jgi:hypothetical protein
MPRSSSRECWDSIFVKARAPPSLKVRHAGCLVRFSERLTADAHLTDILSPSNVTELMRSQPGLAEKLKPLLPPSLGLAEGSTADDLIPILTAPQFTDAVASLDNALRSGGLPGSMMRELGLPEDAGSSVGQFLEALKNLQPKDEDDRMDQD